MVELNCTAIGDERIRVAGLVDRIRDGERVSEEDVSSAYAFKKVMDDLWEGKATVPGMINQYYHTFRVFENARS